MREQQQIILGRIIHESPCNRTVDRRRLCRRVRANQLLRPPLAAENINAQIIHTGETEGDALGAANKVGYRSKMFASADGATISIQVGNVPKHMHPNTNEMQ
jgi:hypothetical protein